ETWYSLHPPRTEMEISSASWRSKVQSLIAAMCSTRSTGWDKRAGSYSITDIDRFRPGNTHEDCGIIPHGSGYALDGPQCQRSTNRPRLECYTQPGDSRAKPSLTQPFSCG